MPIYSAWLDRKIDESPIRFERRRLDSSALSSLEADITINCLGSGSSLVFPELGSGLVYRGILLRAGFDAPPKEVVSYNYTPEVSVYCEGDDTPTDLYFFPRNGHCMLGGTRQLGRIRDGDRAFVAAAPPTSDTVEIDGIDVPRPMIDVNRELIGQLTGSVPSEPYKAVVGYRHLAGDPDAPRLVIEERVNHSGPPIVDCFGFGGAGVTLSWGAALKTMRIVDSALGDSPGPQGPARLESLTRSLMPANP